MANSEEIKENKKKSDDFPLKLLEIVFTTFLITTVLGTLFQMREAGCEIIISSLRYAPLWIPIAYVGWIYKIGYTHKDFLSNLKIRKVLYFTSALALLITLSQIEEFYHIYHNISSNEDFVRVYTSSTIFHPFFCGILVALLLYEGV